MRIMTVRPPWSSAIIHGNDQVPAKNVENRTRNIAGSYRGLVAVHSGLAFDEEAFDKPTGPLSDWFNWVTDGDMWMNRGHSARGDEPCGGCCSVWAEHDTVHLVLANPRPLRVPIPFKGGLGLRRLDADTVALIEAEIA